MEGDEGMEKKGLGRFGGRSETRVSISPPFYYLSVFNLIKISFCFFK